MPISIRISITGHKKTARALLKISSDLKNTAIPLDRASKKYLNAIARNFKDEGRTFGEAWAPLSPATIGIKRALRKEGKSIGVTKPLLRTGLMRRSFGFELVGRNLSRIFNTQAYAQIHQEGGVVTNTAGRKVTIPRRVLFAVDSARIKTVAATFNTWLKEIIRKQGAGKR